MKKVLSILLIILVVCMPTRIEADTTSDVTLSFDLTVEDRFTYEVKVSEGGSLYDGSQRITNGIMEYQLSVGQEKVFQIRPDIGYEVKWIYLNGETRSIDREIKIKGVSGNSVLEVKYGRIHEEPDMPDAPDSPNKPEIPEKPNNPDNPSIPGRPTGPNRPVLPSIPNIPNRPNKPEWIEQPRVPGVVDRPKESIKTNTPEIDSDIDTPVGTSSPSQPKDTVIKEEETSTGIKEVLQGKEGLYSYRILVVVVVGILIYLVVKRGKKEDKETY